MASSPPTRQWLCVPTPPAAMKPSAFLPPPSLSLRRHFFLGATAAAAAADQRATATRLPARWRVPTPATADGGGGDGSGGVAASSVPAAAVPPTTPRMLSAQVRVRQHVNPLASHFQAPLDLPPGWYADSFTNPSAPLHLDIGCGKGRWAATAAATSPGVNYLGVEIRAPLVDQANGWAAAAAAAMAAAGGSGARNVAFLAANANVVLADLLSAHIPSGVLASASVQFPDPHFKRRHRKRRTLTPALAMTLAAAMPPGGTLLVQSDVRAVADAMCEVLEAARWGGREVSAAGGGEGEGAMWTPATGAGAVWRAGAVEVEATTEAEAAAPPRSRPTTNREWLVDNPTGVPTEREVCVLRNGGAVYRQLYARV